MSYCWHQGAPISVGDVTYQPRWLLPHAQEVVSLRQARVFQHAWDFCTKVKPRRVVFYRTFALGDVLMLIPVAKLFHRLLKLSGPIVLVTGFEPWRALGGSASERVVKLGGFWVTRSHGIRDYGADVHFNLDGCLEADHRGGEASDLHRVELYARFLGIP